jgi:cytochrome c peroxidase
MLHGFSLQRFGLTASAVLLLLSSCHPDADINDTANNPVPAPTPYNLVVPASLHAVPRVPADNPLTNEGVALGRFLFYEKMLSVDNSVSCGSCHQQDKAFTDGKPVGQGVFGEMGTRSTMPLANVMWLDSLNWDFRFSSIEAQNRRPIESTNEMHQPLAVGVAKLQNTSEYPARFERAFGTRTITEELVLKALAQFQRTLISGNSKFDQSQDPSTGVTLTPDEQAGFLLFSTHPDPYTVQRDPVTNQILRDPVTGAPLYIRGGNCGDCHGSGGLFKSRLVSGANNGLDEFPTDSGIATITRRPHDVGRFGVPSLRNIELTAPYMHDGRFRTLEDVLDHYNEHVEFSSPNLTRDMRAFNSQTGTSLGLTPTEKRQIIAFLKTLTDTEFVNNPKFSDPN